MPYTDSELQFVIDEAVKSRDHKWSVMADTITILGEEVQRLRREIKEMSTETTEERESRAYGEWLCPPGAGPKVLDEEEELRKRRRTNRM